MGRAWLQCGATVIVLAVGCGKEAGPGPVAGVGAPVAPVPTGGTAGAAGAGAGGTGGTTAPMGGAAPVIPGLCDTSAWPQESSADEQAFLDAINAARAAGRGCGDAGIVMPAPLALDPALQTVARCHALEMSEKGELTLNAADGSDTFDRAMRAGYTGSSTATAVTASARDVAMVLEGLLVDGTVCDKLLAPRWVHVGVGASPASETGKRYVNIVTGF